MGLLFYGNVGIASWLEGIRKFSSFSSRLLLKGSYSSVTFLFKKGYEECCAVLTLRYGTGQKWLARMSYV